MIRLMDIVVGAVVALTISLAAARADDSATRLFSDSSIVSRERFSDEVVGSGPDLVFIPGLASSRATWQPTAERLRNRYRLHLIQVAGFAGEAPRGNAAGDVLVPTAEAVDAYLVEQHLAPAVVIGHSLGGTMALYLAEHHPAHLKKVLLVDALPFYAVLMGGPAATADGMKPMAERIRASTTPAPNLDRMIAGMVTAPADRATIAGWSRASDPGTVNRALADDLTLDLRPGLAAISVPITLLYPDYAPAGAPKGQTDTLYQGAYAPVPHKTLVRIDDSLHFIMLDQKASFAAALDAFLAP
ncbi:MAG TPA: alpha/beta fold hydrolase [Rhizomicrobium sp.]|jgi:pimeloyl-[acyl-carrier protein] methyl ester esterase|nr:alpha/beta fold hydrolase [Rhizomicrobium sp.]